MFWGRGTLLTFVSLLKSLDWYKNNIHDLELRIVIWAPLFDREANNPPFVKIWTVLDGLYPMCYGVKMLQAIYYITHNLLK